MIGLTLIGVGEAMLVAAGLGNSPWTVLAQGLGLRTGVSIGTATFVIGVAVLLSWFVIRVRPGIGTIANVAITAYSINVALWILPQPHLLLARCVMVLLGIVCVGSGAVLYLSCSLGPGPRDGLMTGIHARTKWPVPRVRLAIEVSVLVCGWFLGGTVGVATLAYAVLVPKVLGVALAVIGTQFGARAAAPLVTCGARLGTD